MILPGIRQGESPPFHGLDPYTFQELCRDIFDAEPSVATCEIYGKRGESQDGIDLLVHRNNADGIEVGQCKCYEDFPPREIRKASDEFFNHWDRWKQEDVRRFILFVASDLITRPRQDEIIKQTKRYGDYGIRYEVWSAAKMRNKLRSHPGIVGNYLHPPDYWKEMICGQIQVGSSWSDQRGTKPSVMDQLDLTTSIVSGEHALQPQRILEDHSGEPATCTEELRGNDEMDLLRWLERTNPGLYAATEKVKSAVEPRLAIPRYPHYTDHSITHSIRVIQKLGALIEIVMNPQTALSHIEMYVLIAAAYIHDIVMQEGNDSKDPAWVREYHHELAREVVFQSVERAAKDHPTLDLLGWPNIVDTVAKVVEGHRRVDLSRPYYDDTWLADEQLRPRLLAALLRLGDELDLDYRRAPLDRMSKLDVPVGSQVHWFKCYYVLGVQIRKSFITLRYHFPESCKDEYERFMFYLVQRKLKAEVETVQGVLVKYIA